MVAWDALDALSHEFELCKIGPLSRVVYLVADGTPETRVGLIRAALKRSGAEAAELRSIAGDLDTASEDSPLWAALTSADIVITNGQPLPDAILSPDRAVLELSPIDPGQLQPHVSLRTRTRALADQLRDGIEMTLQDSHGSDLKISLTNGGVDVDYGFVDDGLRHAHFPAGWVQSTPTAGAVNGELVVMPGDANLGAGRLISSPLRLHILDDHVSQIQGESPDADVVRALFEYANHPNAYGVAGLTVGMNPGLGSPEIFDPRLLDPTLSRLMAGMVTISFGDNPVAGRPCDHTFSVALPTRTVTIDGLPVATGGQLQGDFAPDVYEL